MLEYFFGGVYNIRSAVESENWDPEKTVSDQTLPKIGFWEQLFGGVPCCCRMHESGSTAPLEDHLKDPPRRARKLLTKPSTLGPGSEIEDEPSNNKITQAISLSEMGFGLFPATNWVLVRQDPNP